MLNKKRLKKLQCPICDSKNLFNESPYRNINEKNIFARFVSFCKKCSLRFANPLPTSKQLIDYNKKYWINAHGGLPKEVYQNSLNDGLTILRVAWIKDNSQELLSKSINVLEIGPGQGKMASKIKEKFKVKNYFAMESDKQCHAALKKLNCKIVKTKTKMPKRFFDLVIMSHVLEHMVEVKKTLRKIRSFMKKNGKIFLEVPCRDDLHKSILEPHTLFFSKKSISKLLRAVKLYPKKQCYFGEKLSNLKNNKAFQIRRTIKIKLKKFFMPDFFLRKNKLIAICASSHQRKAVFASSAYLSSKKPAWWLRIIAEKK